MPLIAYQGAHGANDFPLHFAFFEALERRGLLDKYDFALDPFHDLSYCQILIDRFPQLALTTGRSLVARSREFLRHRLGRGLRIISSLENSFDAVCEGPGGRIHPLYSGGDDIFWRYPRTGRRAILFHSIEPGVLKQPNTRSSIASADLVIARSRRSAKVARQAGARKVIESSDIVFSQSTKSGQTRAGLAIALRVPNVGVTEIYLQEMRSILRHLESLGKPIDFTRMESPMGDEQDKRNYGTQLHPNITLFKGNDIYVPFVSIREAVISCRLHTTIVSLLAGNRKIMQFQIESGTKKISEMFEDIGLVGLKVHTIEDLRTENIREFVAEGVILDNIEVEQALRKARSFVEVGLDEFDEWLCKIT
jgi:hypothetical protein